MTGTALRAYLAELPALQAEYQLMLVRAAVFPYLKSSEQRAMVAELNRTAAGGKLPLPPPTLAHLKLLHLGVDHVN